jgi:hypothetical protein
MAGIACIIAKRTAQIRNHDCDAVRADRTAVPNLGQYLGMRHGLATASAEQFERTRRAMLKPPLALGTDQRRAGDVEPPPADNMLLARRHAFSRPPAANLSEPAGRANCAILRLLALARWKKTLAPRGNSARGFMP